jgi:hypothetical protein
MTLQEAKQAARDGKKITHRYFTSEEFIEFKGGFIFEDGNKVPLDWWSKDYLNDGWSIFE